jgi:quercetin dioxygenase-like cupin family protein
MYVSSMESKVLEVTLEQSFVEGGITSKTLFHNEISKVVLFNFDAGQQLSEHTASVQAHLFFVSGKAEVVLGDKKITAIPGTWVHMAPQLLHAIYAKERTTMVLTLFHNSKDTHQ